MPIRKNILRKGTAPKQNLLGFDVLQEETGVLGDSSTSKFFKISEFPSVLPTGNSSFLIEGSDLLKPNVELKTEILDSQGNPIFHYGIPNYDRELPARRMAVEVYDDDVVNGVGSFTILGELDPRKVSIPTAFQDTYNVRFSAPISINKAIKNTRPIRFYGDPTLTVSELVKGVIEGVYTGNQKTATITGSVEVNTPIGGIPFLTPPGEKDGLIFGDSTQINEVGNAQISYISKTKGEAQSSILPNNSFSNEAKKGGMQYRRRDNKPTYVVKAMEAGIDNADDKITGTMEGATLTINSPHNLVDSNRYPDADWTKPTTFSTKILKVINSTTFRTSTSYRIRSKKRNTELVVPLQPSGSQVSITHNVGSVVNTASQIFQRSYANMTVGNLQTFSGDTYKAKVYMKEDGSSGEFEKIYETLVESPNELIDQNSDTGFKSVGIFPTQSIIDNFWVTSSVQFVATRSLAAGTSADDTMIDGIILSGSTEPHANSFTFETSQSYSLEKNEPYLVDFDVAFKPTNKVQSDGTEKKDAKLEVFLTGPITSNSSEEFPLGEVELDEYDFNKINTFTVVKKKQISDFLTHNETNAPSGSLGFRVSSGEFILSDVRLRPFSETNFSPGFFKANVPMQRAIKRGQAYDFLVEFYDANNSLAEAVAVADDVTFAGPRQVLGDGNDGVLTGSVFLSNTEDTGIEFHGGSAYIRSIGYNGFNRALDSGGSGFMMYSGSVSKSLNTSESYQGVGLELMDNSGANPSSSRFLKFRTNAEGVQSEFEVRTDNFLFGVKGVTNNYISGSNGNLEISSSNFALQEDGDVVIEGTITAAVGGTIGGFDITTGSLSGADGFFFISGSASGSLGNFDKSNLFISSSGFQVNSLGDLKANSVTISGNLTATAGPVSASNAAANSGSILGISGSDSATATGEVAVSGSTSATSTGEVGVSGSAAAAVDAATGVSGSAAAAVDAATGVSGSAAAAVDAATGISSSAAVTSDVKDTRAQLVLDNSTANNQKINLVNSTGGIMSSFGKAVKFFGSSSNALQTSSANTNYTEINPDGTIIVKGSATASLFGETAKIFDVADNNTYIEVGGKSIDIISGSVTGSSFGAATSSFFGTGSNDNDRLEIVGDGIQVYKNNIQQVSIGDDVVVGQQAANQSNVQITSGALNFRNNTTTIFSIANDGAVSFDSSDIRTLISGSFVSSSDASFSTAATGISGSTSATVTGEKGISGSTSATVTGEKGISGSTSATATGEKGVSGSAAVTSDVADTRAQLVLNNSSANNQKIDLVNTTGGLLASFGRSAKFFGSASNAADSVEINPDGINIIANAKTASIFNAGGAAIMGGNSTASINAAGLSLIQGARTGSLFTATTSSMFGSNDKHERVELVGTGMKVYENNLEVSSFGSTVRVGAVGDNKSRLEIDSDGNLSIINRQGTTDTTVVSLDKDGDGTFSGDLSAAGGTFSGQLVIGGSNTSLTSAAIAGALAAEISGSSLSGSKSATTTGEAAKSDAASAQSTADGAETNAQTGISNAATADGKAVTAQAAVDVVESRTIITSADVTVAHNSGHNKGIFNAAGLTVIGNNQTGSIFGNFGAEIYGASDKKERTLINPTGVSIIANNITGSSFTATTSSVFGASNKHERVEIVGTGMKVYENNKQMVNIGSSGLDVFDTSNNRVARFGSDITLTAGTFTINDGTRDRLLINSSDITMTDEAGNQTFNIDTNVMTLGEVAANQENVVIDPTNGVQMRTNTTTHAQLAGTAFTMGEVASGKSNVHITAGRVVFRNNTDELFAIETDGTIAGDDFIIEKTRLFGAGGDGNVVLKSNECTVANGAGSAARVNATTIRDENGTTVCTRVNAIWTMQGDWYVKNLEVDTSVAATTLITNGFRLFVKNTLTIDANCIIHNDGAAGGVGIAGDTSSQKAGGAAGVGGAGNSLTAGPSGGAGGNGGNAGTGSGPQYGGSGGAGGGAGGIVFISARVIVNNGIIRSHGGAGGAGGNGAGNAEPAVGQTAAAAGGAGNAGTVVHIEV